MRYLPKPIDGVFYFKNRIKMGIIVLHDYGVLMTFQKNDIVTLALDNNSSNAYYVDTDEGDTVLLTHPVAKGVFIRISKASLNTVSANVKDSVERCLDYANFSRRMLDYNTNLDLDALGICFFVKRKLTPRQKNVLANICGILASIRFNNDLKLAMAFVESNVSILDEFNLMWYNNFKGLFQGRQPVTSKKQRGAIFNIAGYVLAELETPSTPK